MLYDVAVVGLGIYGLSITAQAAQAGMKVIAFDLQPQRASAHNSSGETRLSRLATFEDLRYAAFARESQVILRRMQRMSRQTLYRETGFLFISEPGSEGDKHHSRDHVLDGLRRVASSSQVEHSLLERSSIEAHGWPLHVSPGARAYFEPSALTVYADRLNAHLRREAKRAQAELMYECEVLHVTRSAAICELQTTKGPFQASKVIYAVGEGAGANQLGRLPRSSVYQQPVVWASGPIQPRPVTVLARPGQPLAFAFPRLHGTRGVKVVHEHRDLNLDRVTPDQLRHAMLIARHDATATFTRTKVIDSAWCSYVCTPRSRLLIHVGDNEHEITLSCCSGHGYKYALAIGARVVSALDQRQPKLASLS